ncbi:hypothetical protein [Chryseobacterium tongliaoense]|uniref:hypothetical protein n=1 Tax=Chryseobacterium tongliaoense TaxID=3240933 RepID=UPI0035112FEC
MIKKILSGCLLMTVLFFFSCDKKNTSQVKSETSIETISIITALTMGIAIAAAYTVKRRQ